MEKDKLLDEFRDLRQECIEHPDCKGCIVEEIFGSCIFSETPDTWKHLDEIQLDDM